MQKVDEEVYFNNKNMNNTVTEQGESTLNYTYSNQKNSQNNDENQQSKLTNNDTSSPNQSRSLFSEQSTPVRRASDNIIEDRFNGILYHVIHSDGHITIIFSSKDLYNKFIDSINKELHAQQINEVRANYTTHVRGKGCTLISDNNAASVTASGPGCKLWRETIFLRHAAHLYQQFTREIDNEINAQTSTPTTTVSQKDLSSPPVSPVTHSGTGLQHKIAKQNLTLSELNNQVAELYKISKHLQEQLLLVNSKLDSLLKKSNQLTTPPKENAVPPKISDLSLSTISEESTYLTLSETHDDSKLAPGGASYRDIVISTSEKVNLTNNQTESVPKSQDKSKQPGAKDKNSRETTKSRDAQKHQSTPTTTLMSQLNDEHHGRTLLLGDSILSGINRKGLKKGVECKPVPGATISAILDTIEIFDVTKFDSIVVYVGGNDASNETELGYFRDQYEELITLIKGRNSKCRVFLSTVCPRGDVDVVVINDVIRSLCQSHDLICINSNADFYDKKKQLRGHFYKPRDNIHFSRSGIKRLLGSVERHVSVVENFENCVYLSGTTYQMRTFNQRRPRPQTHNFRNKDFHNGGTHNRNGQHGKSDYFIQDKTPENGLQERCLKCGMTNHETFYCRHKKQVQCHNCKMFGHKDTSGLCSNL